MADLFSGRKMLSLLGVGLSGVMAVAADSYYWNDSGDHDLMNRANWRVSNASGVVPEKWPPALDTATSGATHPYIYVPTSARLSLPTSDEITLNDLIFNTAGTDNTIDLGSRDKKIKLFGNADSAIWVGQNYPDGERVTLRSGTLTGVAATQRNRSIRLGGTMTTNKRMSGFYVDGPDAVVSNLIVSIDSPRCEFVVTNGGTAYIGGANYAIRMKQKVGDSLVRVSGEGSRLHHLTRSNGCFLFGDAITNPDAKSGGVEITDGGVITNANGTIGNRAGNYYVKMDNGTWDGQMLTLGGLGTSTNNSLIARNHSRLAFDKSIKIGAYGGFSTAKIESSDLVTPEMSVGDYGDGEGHNEVCLSNVEFSVTTFNIGGSGADGSNACNNTLTIRDSVARAKSAINVSSRVGGATNHLVLADSELDLGAISVGLAFRGRNTVLVTNCTLSATFQIAGNSGVGQTGTDCNVVRFVDSRMGTPTELKTTIAFADSYKDYPARSNRLEFVRSTWFNKASYLGIGGWSGSNANRRGNDGNVMILDDRSLVVCTNGSNGVSLGGFGFGNRLEVLNGSEFLVKDMLSLGALGAHHSSCGTNVVRVGKNARVVVNGILQACPGGNGLEIDDGVFAARFLKLHYFHSDAQNKTVDSLTAAEAEYQKPASEIWGTRFAFKGAHPILICPDPAGTTSSTSGLSFDRSCVLSFELPETPYENPPLQSGLGVSFGDGTSVRFDVSNVGKPGGRYVLADQTSGGTLTVSDAQLVAMQSNLTAAAVAVQRKARIFVDGKKLVVKVSSQNGLVAIIR